MFKVLIKLCLLWTFLSAPTISSGDKTLVIISKGILPVSKQDIGLSFYVDVENQSNEDMSLSTKMVHCCELVTEDDNDCDHMHLVGGQMGTLPPRQTRSVTLIYVTLYPYNRKGTCTVAVYYKRPSLKKTLALKTEILFDTLVTDGEAPEALRHFYDPTSVTLCDSPDQDPMAQCAAVNCHWKYGGTRSFFNNATKRCEQVPLCSTNLESELPDVVYVPNINQCKDLSVPIGESDVKQLTRSLLENTRFTAPDLPMVTNVHCHHGNVNTITGFCTCHQGWSSESSTGEDFVPSTVPYHMCTVKSLVKTTHAQRDRISPMSNVISTVTCLATAIMIVLFSIVTHDCWIYQEKSRALAQGGVLPRKRNRVQFALSKNSIISRR